MIFREQIYELLLCFDAPFETQNVLTATGNTYFLDANACLKYHVLVHTAVYSVSVGFHIAIHCFVFCGLRSSNTSSFIFQTTRVRFVFDGEALVRSFSLPILAKFCSSTILNQRDKFCNIKRLELCDFISCTMTLSF